MAKADWFSQSPHRVRMDWGWRGCSTAAARGDAIVIVDVLRFSTAVCAAAARGVIVFPANQRDDLHSMCIQFDADHFAAGLAPDMYQSAGSGWRVVLRSPNGATCVRLATAAPVVMIGALVNRSAVAKCVRRILDDTKLNVTVIACGERWSDPSDDGELRFAIEDYLGAGSILSRTHGDLSAEANACANAFSGASGLQELIANCASGREQIDKDDRGSVEHAAMVDRYDVVPVLRDGWRLEALADISEITSLAKNAR
ncbi:MAG: 2-phosphosulfolactate phosphatase [Anaerolineae bacterium]|nr:2-phosphosulfolactate phosphatase [Phycisphaerae bacterium]